MTRRVLVVDHFDSFSFILGEQFARTGATVETVRSDASLPAFSGFVDSYRPHLVVLSPGPGRPEACGVTLPWLSTDPQVPILGICLGHQALAVAAGGTVDLAAGPVHGRASQVVFAPLPEFRGNGLLPALVPFVSASAPFPAARYHSLCVTAPGRRQRVLATARGEPGLVMALATEDRPRLGLQFHPESVLTPWGGHLVQRILECAASVGTPGPGEST